MNTRAKLAKMRSKNIQNDLNDQNNLTVANVGKLLASKDDSKPRQMRVTNSGIKLELITLKV